MLYVNMCNGLQMPWEFGKWGIFEIPEPGERLDSGPQQVKGRLEWWQSRGAQQTNPGKGGSISDTDIRKCLSSRQPLSYSSCVCLLIWSCQSANDLGVNFSPCQAMRRSPCPWEPVSRSSFVMDAGTLDSEPMSTSWFLSNSNLQLKTGTGRQTHGLADC